MSRRHTLGHVVAYHGCDAVIGEKVLAGTDTLKPSLQDYDWLGNGIYFWADSPERAWDWANERRAQGKIEKPFVLGALIYPGLCLNLTDYGVIEELRAAFDVLKTSRTGKSMPVNTKHQNNISMVRRLDCAVIQMLHEVRTEAKLAPYDTVYGVFDEGNPAYEGAGFLEKTHIQLAVRNPEVIIGYFRVNTSQFVTT